ncbi:MAG: hypothetical protein NDF54_00985 [archaeon GB-1867-035]|nr:hypothetical protein [Candidatus Culexmicrobium profundum]
MKCKLLSETSKSLIVKEIPIEDKSLAIKYRVKTVMPREIKIRRDEIVLNAELIILAPH